MCVAETVAHEMSLSITSTKCQVFSGQKSADACGLHHTLLKSVKLIIFALIECQFLLNDIDEAYSRHVVYIHCIEEFAITAVDYDNE
jgi:hypothetical protein